jgi:hypothetical protein
MQTLIDFSNRREDAGGSYQSVFMDITNPPQKSRFLLSRDGKLMGAF